MPTIFLLFSVSAMAQQDDEGVTRALLLTAEDVAARAAELDTEVAYANTTVLEREDANTSTGVAYRLAVDRRTPPQRAASHTNEAELWAIVEGSGAITTDGRIVETMENGESRRTCRIRSRNSIRPC
jgi:mannose-6-phosphate isomerase-like protein (cupin superfamily)